MAESSSAFAITLFNPLFKLADLAFEKSFETAVHILQFSAYVLLATR